MPEISVAVVRPDAPLEKVCLLGYVHACTRVPVYLSEDELACVCVRLLRAR